MSISNSVRIIEESRRWSIGPSFRQRCIIDATARPGPMRRCGGSPTSWIGLSAGLLWLSIAPLLTLQTARADQVILTSGERFSSSRVWEEGDKLRFDMQGLIVSVNKEDVAQVIRDNAPATAPEALQPAAEPARQARPPVPAVQPSDMPLVAPTPKAVSDEPAISDRSARRSALRGIGIDGLAWHMKPDQIPGIERLNRDPAYGGIDQYWRPGESLTLGQALLDGLILGFWQNRLYSIMLWVDGEPAYARLQRAVFDRYGEGRKNPQGLERFIWSDQTTDRMLEFDPKLNTGIFWMRSRDLDQQIKMLYPQ